MSVLPLDVDPLSVNDHVFHHEILHDLVNDLIAAGGPGLVFGKIADGTTTDALGGFYPHYTFPNQVVYVNHTSSGPLNLAAQRSTKLFKVSASADITSVNAVGLELLGPEFAEVVVHIEALNPISINWAGSLPPLGVNVPAALPAGGTVTFPAVRVA